MSCAVHLAAQEHRPHAQLCTYPTLCPALCRTSCRTLQGPAPYVEELVFDCGVPVSEDFQLLGLAWADAVVQVGAVPLGFP